MDNQTLKHEILEWISKTEDDTLLHTLKSIKDSNSAANDWLTDLSQDELDSLNRGVADHESGDTLTSKAFWAGYGSKI